MLSVALGGVHFRHLGRPIRSGALQLYKHILQLRKDEGIMLMTGSEVKDIGMKQVSSERALLNELHHLHLVVSMAIYFMYHQNISCTNKQCDEQKHRK